MRPYGACAAELMLRRDHGKRVGSDDDVRVEHGQKPVEVSAAQGGEKGAGKLSLARENRING